MCKYSFIGQEVETDFPIILGDIERRSGLYVLGKPGMGKSNFLINLMWQDIENGHGLFFLDPHGDAISDLLRHIESYNAHRLRLINPEHETLSIGINLLACPNLTSLKERVDTYTRAYSIFYKLWGNMLDERPWLQLIIQNTLYAFIENQEYTLAEVPYFLTNPNFRRHIVKNIKYNTEVADFWTSRFETKREHDQERQVETALTRISTLLGHPYIKHIIGQHKTTLNFAEVMEKKLILLVQLPASLSGDNKKFIGIILISELLHAVRNRPIDKRHQFCIFVDEFQNFASSEDFATLITEARKFGIATTIAHQERYGQLEDNKKMLGATLAAANKVFFQLTVKDAQELAPEFAQKPEGTEKHREAILIFSPRTVEDIWEKGYPNEIIMDIRERYFWLVNLLKSKPHETYFQFDPTRLPQAHLDVNTEQLQWREFDDWEMYRSSADMLREGISLLNTYYYDWMQHEYDENKPVTDKQLNLILKGIECFAGVFGFRPTMMPYIPEEMRLIYLHRVTEDKDKLVKDLNYDYQSRRIIKFQLQEYLKKVEREYKMLVNVPSDLDLHLAQIFRENLIYLGVSQYELEKFIQWRTGQVNPLGTKHLVELIRHTMNVEEKKRDRKEWLRNISQIAQEYYRIMICPYLKNLSNLSSEEQQQYKLYCYNVLRRLCWQASELQIFVCKCFYICGRILEREPIKVPSGKYEEKLKIERTQIDLINEMVQELTNLPRFTAYVKWLYVGEGEQEVLKCKMKTLSPQLCLSDKDFVLPPQADSYYKKREEVEEEIKQRWEKWKVGSSTPPPTILAK